MLPARSAEVKGNKTNKNGKWKEIKKRLKAKGMLKPMANIDESKIDMNIPAFPQDIIRSESIECGFFEWYGIKYKIVIIMNIKFRKFKFFNKQINGEKILKNANKKEKDDNRVGGGGAPAVQQNQSNKLIKEY